MGKWPNGGGGRWERGVRKVWMQILAGANIHGKFSIKKGGLFFFFRLPSFPSCFLKSETKMESFAYFRGCAPPEVYRRGGRERWIRGGGGREGPWIRTTARAGRGGGEENFSFFCCCHSHIFLFPCSPPKRSPPPHNANLLALPFFVLSLHSITTRL